MRLDMVVQQGNSFYAWDGRIYDSDIVRSCLRPKVKAVGKMVGKHIRRTITNGATKLEINPDAHIRLLLEEPNPYMSGQKLQEKMAAQLCLNNNAFALIIRDENGYAMEIYPLPATGAEAIYSNTGELYIKFNFRNGKMFTFPYRDIIHLRQDYNENDIFGTSLINAIAPLMEIVNTTDQGIVRAIKNSSVVQWLLKYHTALRAEDIRENAKTFAESYLNISNSKSIGVAAVDSKAEAIRIDPKDYVPNAPQMDKTTERIYSLFNTNRTIVQSSFTEDEWNSYYEAEIEPVAVDLRNEFTRKIFTRRERGFGNTITFEASNLSTASTSTKLNFHYMIDRGALTPNEWRYIFNMAPVEGGDDIIRRLDTVTVKAVNALTDKMGGGNDVEILKAINLLLQGGDFK